MEQSNPSLHALAGRHDPGDAAATDARDSLDKLRAHFVTLVGTAAFHALVSRALALASRDVDWLDEVRVADDGSLDGFDDAVPERSADEAARGRKALLTRQVALLESLIGEDLTQRLVRDAWGDAPADETRTLAQESPR
jgi:hypothetical protein